MRTRLSICVSVSHLASNENENNSSFFPRCADAVPSSTFQFHFQFLRLHCVYDERVCSAVELYASSLNGATEPHTPDDE